MKRHATHGQVAMEYLFVVGFGFVLLIPVIILFYSQAGVLDTEVTAAQAKKSIDEIVSAVNLVYALGEPSKQTLRVRFPEHVTSVDLLNNTIIMTVQSPPGPYVVTGVAGVNLTGSIDVFAGTHVLEIQALPLQVNITEN